MTIGTTLYGTNDVTGVFEPIPNAPPIVSSFTNIRQIDEKDGSKAWYGTDPADGKFKRMDDLPVIPASAQGWGDLRQIDNGQGQMEWWGVDPSDHQYKKHPTLPSTAKVQGPASITQNKVTYVQQPDGTYKPAPGVPDPNPPKGIAQIILGPDGYLYRQISRGDGTFDPDTSFAPVPFTDAAKQARGQISAQHQPGEKGTKLIQGKVYQVTYRGGSDDNYDIDTSQAATPMPGAESPTSIATGTDQPTIVQRMPDGSIKNVPNPNYQPTDPALRVAQLSNQASAKLQEIQAKIGPGFTPDQAQSEFDAWWNTNVEPAKTQLQQTQQKTQADVQRQQQEQERANYATALTAGSNAVEAYKAQMPNMVGPGFGAAVNQLANAWTSGKPVGNVDIASAVQYQPLDLNQLQQNAVNSALAHISPTAAQGLGGGMPAMAQQQYDVTANLNRSNYQFQPGTTTVAPDGTVTVQHAQQPVSNQPTTMNIPAMPGAVGAAQSAPLPSTYPSFIGNAVGQQLNPALSPYQPSF
jgi:hypothetical protein